MAILDPIECLQARELIEAGQLAEAVRLLAGGGHREHRAVRRLLLELGPRLVAQANELWAQGALEPAWQAIALAAQCITLEGQALQLQQAIAAARAEALRHQQWQAQRLDDAQRLAAQGHVRTALGKLAAIDHPEADRLRLDIEEKLARFERYLAGARKLLDQGQPHLMRPLLEKAARILPHDPELLRLAHEWQTAITPANPLSRSAALPASCWGFGPWAWVVPASEVLLGRPGEPGVQVPLAGGVRARHARILRDAGQYRLIPCLDDHGAPCRVAVNGQPVLQTALLGHGDHIALGQPPCALVFRLPVTGSSTAVLESRLGDPAPVHSGDGDRFSRVVLLDQEMLVSPTRPAHLVLPDLPCRRLVWRCRQGRLELQADGGTLASGDLDPQPEACRPATPGRWLLRSELEEAEILGRAAAGLEPSTQLSFRLTAH